MRNHSGFAGTTGAGLIEGLADLAAEASRAILAIRAGAIDARLKPDGSPATAADDTAEAVILAGLARLLPAMPVVSEERAERTRGVASASFVLVDPLDGTRELLAGRDEFTVNIAVIRDGAPAAGVIAAPALGALWTGIGGGGAERRDFTADWGSLRCRRPIRSRPWPAAPVAMVSRSHPDPATQTFLRRFPGIRTEPCGSSLKFCRLAEGGADLYPRLARTSEWDIAAGHALVVAAGGAVLSPTGAPLRYGVRSSEFFVPAFVAVADAAMGSRIGGP